MAPLRIGLIGAGFMGARHALSLSAVSEAQLVAVSDLDHGRALALAGPAGASAYADYQEMLARESLDAVIVATSDAAHRDPCVAAARAGAHLLVEKPLATSLEDCDAIAAAAKENGVKLLVGHTLRWEPRYALAQQAAREGRLGTISYLYARRNNMQAVARRVGASTTVARFLAVHDIDWMQWVLGEKAQSAVARTARRVLTDLGTPDVYFVLLRFPSGALACVEASWILPDTGSWQRDFQAEVVGSKGSLYISANDQGLQLDAAGGLQFPDILYGPTVQGIPQGVYVDEVRHFVEVIRGEAEPRCTAADGRAAVAAVLAAEQSAVSGEEVRVG